MTSRGRATVATLLLAATLWPWSAGAETAAAGKLQLYVMPDTQSWAFDQGGTTLETWRSVARALCAKRSRFAMVLHTGDLVDNPQQPLQWSNAISVMRELDACQMPYAIAFGNHDFDNYSAAPNLVLQGDRGWQAAVAQLAHHPAAKAPSGRSALYPLAEGWFVLTADYVASQADLDWIASAIAARPEARFVLLNHSCVNAQGLVAGDAFAWCRRLLEQPRIRVAVSGHWLGATRDGWHETKRANAPPLLALFQNYQHVPALAAWGVVVELDLASGGACVWSENLLTNDVGHPAVSTSPVGSIAAGSKRRCFGSAQPGL